MAALRFRKAPEEIRLLLGDITGTVEDFRHVDPERVHIIFSNSKTRALAFCHQMSRRIQFALDLQPNYIIEFVERQWNKMSPEERAKIVIHELYHIPRTFSGNLREHKRGFSSYSRTLEDRIFRKYVEKHPERTEEEARNFIERHAIGVF